MAEEVKAVADAGKPADKAAEQAPGTHRLKINGADRVVSHEDVIAAAQKNLAGQNLLDQLAKDKEAWINEQRQTLNDARFGVVFRKAVVERDPEALKEVMVGLGGTPENAAKVVAGWEQAVAGKPEPKPNEGATVDAVLGQVVQALTAADARYREMAAEIKALKGTTNLLDSESQATAMTKLDAQIEKEIQSDEFHGHFAGKSKRYLDRVRKEAVAALERRLRAGEKPTAKSPKEALEEARATVEDIADGILTDDAPPISGLGTPPGRSRLDAHRPKKAPDPIAARDPAKYAENLGERLAAWLPEITKAAHGE
jgi:HPt (histidine-containing phosphotransfer) domain-containing protein